MLALLILELIAQAQSGLPSAAPTPSPPGTLAAARELVWLAPTADGARLACERWSLDEGVLFPALVQRTPPATLRYLVHWHDDGLELWGPEPRSCARRFRIERSLPEGVATDGGDLFFSLAGCERARRTARPLLLDGCVAEPPPPAEHEPAVGMARLERRFRRGGEVFLLVETARGAACQRWRVRRGGPSIVLGDVAGTLRHRREVVEYGYSPDSGRLYLSCRDERGGIVTVRGDRADVVQVFGPWFLTRAACERLARPARLLERAWGRTLPLWTSSTPGC